ncbi:Phosphate transporter [Zostera marina]|uniref:H(+)/Pi cotransporter n=1 Tax=Zostera marina TaxID=29655 RepID=A0A0K9NRZ9_ZOSMR|nr:Phosphate transporter [Zostera marina]
MGRNTYTLRRKLVYGMTLMIMVICSIASGLSFRSSPKCVMTTLCFFRFFLGFGIGEDYPLSTTNMSEYVNMKTRGAFVVAVFAMQGFGILVGAIPAALTFYSRSKMPETTRYTTLVAKNMKQANENMSKVLQVDIQIEENPVVVVLIFNNNFGLFSREFVRKHGLHLVGTCMTWFLLDIAFYNQNLFQKDIFTAVGWIHKPASMNAIEEVYNIARAQTFIALLGTVPGYWVTVFLIDRIRRFKIQTIRFGVMSLFMGILAYWYNYWKSSDHRIGFIVLYAYTFFFANFGPSAITFIVHAKIFPARLRSTCHGISAVLGKAEAIIGAFGFLYAAQNQDGSKTDHGYSVGIGVRNSLFILTCCNLLGLVFSFLVPETKGRSLKEITGENNEEN